MLREMWNAFSPGFELVSPCPIPATITITPRAPPYSASMVIAKNTLCKLMCLRGHMFFLCLCIYVRTWVKKIDYIYIYMCVCVCVCVCVWVSVSVWREKRKVSEKKREKVRMRSRCNSDLCRKWIPWLEFKSLKKLFAIIPMKKAWIQLVSLQRWVNIRADWAL